MVFKHPWRKQLEETLPGDSSAGKVLLKTARLREPTLETETLFIRSRTVASGHKPHVSSEDRLIKTGRQVQKRPELCLFS